jgi:mannose-6-phosphate isomerase-like protein (cupin superfamily)/GNAT superfamily N-acetyltransferase
MEKVILAEKLGLIAEHWRPRVVGELNGQEVKLVKFEGTFVWHHHEVEDELFLAVAGQFRLEFRDHVVELRPGELIIVPHGVEHRTVADEEAAALVFEPAATRNTGNVVHAAYTAPTGARPRAPGELEPPDGAVTAPAWSVKRLQSVSASQLGELASLLMDCVEGGASVSFMQPLERERALAFWSSVASAVASGERALLVAEDSLGICGTAQLVLSLPQNQPHRADVSKVLVHRRARRQGLGAALMRAAEATARECGRDLLVLDTVTGGDAQRLYERLGWVRVGDVPRFALMPTGEFCSTTFYYRDLRQSDRAQARQLGDPSLAEGAPSR